VLLDFNLLLSSFPNYQYKPPLKARLQGSTISFTSLSTIGLLRCTTVPLKTTVSIADASSAELGKK
jgi:hypothetical protein